MNKLYYIILGILLTVIISMGSILVYRSLTEKSDKTLETTSYNAAEESNTLEEGTNNIDYSKEYPEEVKTDYDKEMINYFSNAKEEINSYNNTSNFDKVKSKGKEYFITMADFLFYDKDIKGVYLKDISEGTKEVLWKIFTEIDSVIIKVYPDYKDDLSSSYSVIKDVGTTTFNKALDTIKETIGEENYNKGVDIKNSAKEKTKNTYSRAKESIKNWYEKFREDNSNE